MRVGASAVASGTSHCRAIHGVAVPQKTFSSPVPRLRYHTVKILGMIIHDMTPFLFALSQTRSVSFGSKLRPGVRVLAWSLCTR